MDHFEIVIRKLVQTEFRSEMWFDALNLSTVQGQ